MVSITVFFSFLVFSGFCGFTGFVFFSDFEFFLFKLFSNFKICSYTKFAHGVLLVSFRRYFVIDEDSLCIATMYYLFQWIYIVLIVQKKKKSPPTANLQGLSEAVNPSLTAPSLTVPVTTIAHVQAIVRYCQDNLADGWSMHLALKVGEKKKVITTESAKTNSNLGAQDLFFSWMLTTATSLGTGEATPSKVMAADADHSRVSDYGVQNAPMSLLRGQQRPRPTRGFAQSCTSPVGCGLGRQLCLIVCSFPNCSRHPVFKGQSISDIFVRHHDSQVCLKQSN
jgi:hypothetical protein